MTSKSLPNGAGLLKTKGKRLFITHLTEIQRQILTRIQGNDLIHQLSSLRLLTSLLGLRVIKVTPSTLLADLVVEVEDTGQSTSVLRMRHQIEKRIDERGESNSRPGITQMWGCRSRVQRSNELYVFCFSTKFENKFLNISALISCIYP